MEKEYFVRRSAFTLAEVLITLGIIGVVSAITIPTLITNYQKHQTVNALKQAYVILGQAIELANLEHDALESWDIGEFKNTYLVPYLKNARDFKGVYPYKEEILWHDNATGKTSCCLSAFTCVATSQGYYYCPRWISNGQILIDINGNKGPNRLGRDIFVTKVYKDKDNKYKLKMAENRPLLYDHHCIKTGGNNGTCGLRIQQAGWKIDDGYPWFNY